MSEILTLLFLFVVVPIFEDEVNDPQSTGAPYHVTEEHRHGCVLTGNKQNAEEQHCNDDACKNSHDFLCVKCLTCVTILLFCNVAGHLRH